MKKNNFALPVGIIDIGSNSVRLMFTDGIFIKKNLITTRLGGGFLDDGSLSVGSMLTTVNAVKELKNLALEMGANKVFAFATAAVRNAKNQKEFTSLIKEVCELKLDIVSGETEAELAVLGALNGENGCVIDVGGASAEIACFNGESVYYKKSYNIGAVTLYNECGRIEKTVDECLNKVFNEPFNISENTVKAVGGTATSLGAIYLGLEKYDSNRVHNTYISLEELKKLKDMLYTLTPNGIFDKFAIDRKRADVISGGASIFLHILKKYNLSGFTVSESDNLEGYLKKIKG